MALSLEYLAGYFDGEGCVCISTHRSQARDSRGYSVRHTLHVAVTGTNPTVLREFLRFGGSLHARTKMYSPRHTPSFDWIVVCDQAARFLEVLRPYLAIKGPDADIGIEFQRIVRERAGRFKRLTSEDLGAREKLRLTLVQHHGHATRAAV